MSNMNRSRLRRMTARGLVCAALAGGAAAPCVYAQAGAPVAAPAELAQAEALIEALVQRGLLPRARADVLIREARTRAGMPVEAPAAAPAAAPPPTPPSPSQARRGGRDAAAEKLKAELRDEVRRELRDEVRNEVRNEVRDEVLTQADALARKAGSAAREPAAAEAKAAAATGPAAAAVPVAPAAPVATPTAPAAEPAPAAPPPAAAAPEKIIRVPYVPQVVRDQIRAQIKEEVLAQARAEQWGTPSAAPGWTQRVTVDGDVRVRLQDDRFDKDNLSPGDFVAASLAGVTRAPDLAAATAAGLGTGNTQEDRKRWRLRARLGVDAKINDSASVGLRLATGSATDRVSTNQTLGQNANRYSFLLDRAFVRIDPAPWLALSAGRIANPWFATDLQWSDNLNFEGIAASMRWPGSAASFEPFLTLGYFPIREDAGTTPPRSLSGAQMGLQWDLARTRLRFGLAKYAYSGVEGQVDGDFSATTGAGRTYGQYEYGAALRQRGNTLFLTNNPAEIAAGLTPDRFRWGLASRFRPLAFTVAAELSHFAPFVISLSGELVRNTAFDRDEIARRTGVALTDGSGQGLALRAAFGAPSVRQRGQWQAQFSYRRLGSDAVLDAFTDSDLRLGGTNLSGYTAGFTLGLDRDLTLGLRYLSGKSLDSMTVTPGAKGGFGVDTMQVDLNARF